jgi:hypothetical protein
MPHQDNAIIMGHALHGEDDLPTAIERFVYRQHGGYPPSEALRASDTFHGNSIRDEVLALHAYSYGP